MNQNTSTTIVEINGVKLELDLRTARRIDTLKVGTRVKVLKKDTYGGPKVWHGIIIGFEPFKTLPTIIVATADTSYGSAAVSFVYYNAESKDVELVVSADDDKAALDKTDFLAKVDRDIATKQNEIRELEARRAYFLEKFKCYWEQIEQPAQPDATHSGITASV